ncbi:hypothetical protein KM427_10425 [Nocardioides sp. LMS-CY]|uniref:Uncharacterized protein n=1 Tax=Nocardioides soli TaxID=1036020 RepID=A0A7W4VRN4_9ACTN|nr:MULTISPECIES: hypothetical protein [Nocardioides]MBB3040464.1 hypothetical protein [Nocardioides soli]QWF24060.1 hypothetical protein KM427_10425 [Nocardioides sp. LMS-CY]
MRRIPGPGDAGRVAAARTGYRAPDGPPGPDAGHRGARTLDVARDLGAAGDVQHSAVATARSVVGVS